MGLLYFLLEGLSPHLKPETPNKQDYQLYFGQHADFMMQKQRGN